ncbi:Shikimate 5-dehydrogenase I alpha [Candidatus Palibaumannia cicadellinicola]|uniref:shikimate dehydrogenase (NADP(+)) n=2 Tax=Candidatus Palibaumannia cicadellinicola TaxID=186490 RepID=A0A088MYI9_9GAMM|nr:Shikimate 5-dehydrogenase I alpha [Candidatus Baumannia cicadellinicola]
MQQFFSTNGRGANITSPFKERAFALCDYVTKQASLASAVNTIFKLPNGALFGDNTDGIGLMSDLQRLCLLHRNSRVLLVGAGGAARGVIAPLINYGCRIVLVNRTFSRAKELVRCYPNINNISTLPIEQLDAANFDIIINATTTSMFREIPLLPTSLITSTVCCYDMFYQHGDTAFIMWCRQQGAKKLIDGLGMLVSQAAYAFMLWHGILPSIFPVLEKLRAQLR